MATRDSDNRFMQDAVPESRKGVFGDKARKAGMSTHGYAEKERNAPGRLGKEARLALTFERTSKHHSKHRRPHRGPKTRRKNVRRSYRRGSER